MSKRLAAALTVASITAAAGCGEDAAERDQSAVFANEAFTEFVDEQLSAALPPATLKVGDTACLSKLVYFTTREAGAVDEATEVRPILVVDNGVHLPEEVLVADLERVAAITGVSTEDPFMQSYEKQVRDSLFLQIDLLPNDPRVLGPNDQFISHESFTDLAQWEAIQASEDSVVEPIMTLQPFTTCS